MTGFQNFLMYAGGIIVSAFIATILWAFVRYFFEHFFLNPWDRLTQKEQVWIYHKVVDDYRDKVRQAIASGEIKLPPGLDGTNEKGTDRHEGHYL